MPATIDTAATSAADAARASALLRPTASLADWSRHIERAFGPMRLAASRRAEFSGSFVPLSVAGLDLAAVTGNVLAVEQPRVSNAPDACDWFLVTSLHGNTRIAHAGREVAFGVGDFVLVHEAADRRMRFEGPFHHLSIRLPARFVAEHLEIERADAPRFAPSRSALSRALAPLLRVLTEQPRASAIELDGLRDAAHELIGALLRAGADERTRDALVGPHARRLERARAAIAAHAADPTLSVERIADLAAVSVRTLHRLFAAAGTSVGASLREARLQRFRRDLADARHRERSITEIALQSGYADTAYAARAFRARFGVTPTEFRAERATRRGIAP